MSARHRIAWKSKRTGHEGHGEFRERDREDYEEIAAKLNRDFPAIDHWVEDEPAENSGRALQPEGDKR